MITVADTVAKLVAEGYGVPLALINPGTQFARDLDDSLESVELICECETVFDIQILNEEAADIYTVGDLTSLIERKLRAKS